MDLKTMSSLEIETGKETLSQLPEPTRRDIYEDTLDDLFRILFIFIDKIERYMQFRVQNDLLTQGLRINVGTKRRIDETGDPNAPYKVTWIVEFEIPRDVIEKAAAIEAYIRRQVRNQQLVLKYYQDVLSKEPPEEDVGASGDQAPGSEEAVRGDRKRGKKKGNNR